jgi:hypothetical protein
LTPEERFADARDVILARAASAATEQEQAARLGRADANQIKHLPPACYLNWSQTLSWTQMSVIRLTCADIKASLELSFTPPLTHVRISPTP